MAKNRHIAQRQDERDLQPPTLTVDEAIAIFDKSAQRTAPNAQTEAWKVIRAELMALQHAPVETLYHLGGGHLAAELVLPEVWTALDGQTVRLVATTASGGPRE